MTKSARISYFKFYLNWISLKAGVARLKHVFQELGFQL